MKIYQILSTLLSLSKSDSPLIH